MGSTHVDNAGPFCLADLYLTPESGTGAQGRCRRPGLHWEVVGTGGAARRRAERHACRARLALPPPLAGRVGWWLRREKGLCPQFPLPPSPGGQIHAATAKPLRPFHRKHCSSRPESWKSAVGLDPRTERWSPHGWEGNPSVILRWDPTSPSPRAGQSQQQHRAPGLGRSFGLSDQRPCGDPGLHSGELRPSAVGTLVAQPRSWLVLFPRGSVPAGPRPTARRGCSVGGRK